MRIYLPMTFSGLASAVRFAEVTAVPLTGFAVTTSLREWYHGIDAAADEEELEYIAMRAAAGESLRLVDLDNRSHRITRRQRVVLAADVDEVVEAPHNGRAAVQVETPVSFSRVVSAHVDVAALGAGEAEEEPLAWFAAHELLALVEEQELDPPA
jgi:hypothetical protein